MKQYIPYTIDQLHSTIDYKKLIDYQASNAVYEKKKEFKIKPYVKKKIKEVKYNDKRK